MSDNRFPFALLPPLQRKEVTPKSAANVEMERNRDEARHHPERQMYYKGSLNSRPYSFMSQKELSEIKHAREVKNSIAKRSHA